MWDDPTCGLSIILVISKLRPQLNKKSIYLPNELCVKLVLRDSDGPYLVLGLGNPRAAHVVS